MRLDDYTPDAICRALGLPGFIEAAWAEQREPMMRVLLKPSFHPEVCITINSREYVVSVVTFEKTSLWHSRPGEVLTTWREERPLEQKVCLDLMEKFRQTKDALDLSQSYGCCDGMTIDACLCSSIGTTAFSGNVGVHSGMHAFARSVAEAVQTVCARPEIQTALSATLFYVGGGKPPKRSDYSNSLPVVKLAVIGDPAERSELLKAIEKKFGATKTRND